MQIPRWFHPYDDKPDIQVNRSFLKRVAAYARPYWMQVLLLVVFIAVTAALSLVSPLLIRDLIDNALPNGNITRLNWLALGLFVLPVLTGLGDCAQRQLSTKMGEGIIYDLRRELYSHMQHMSMRFYTHTKTGELMSRLNNDVNGAQEAIVATCMSGSSLPPTGDWYLSRFG